MEAASQWMVEEKKGGFRIREFTPEGTRMLIHNAIMSRLKCLLV